jgi:hypothetical protein
LSTFFNTKVPFLFKIVDFFTFFRKSQKFGYALDTGKGQGAPIKEQPGRAPKMLKLCALLAFLIKITLRTIGK